MPVKFLEICNADFVITSHSLGDVVLEETSIGLKDFSCLFVQRILGVGFLREKNNSSSQIFTEML